MSKIMQWVPSFCDDRKRGKKKGGDVSGFGGF